MIESQARELVASALPFELALPSATVPREESLARAMADLIEIRMDEGFSETEAATLALRAIERQIEKVEALVDPGQARAYVLNIFLSALDPHSAYLPPDQGAIFASQGLGFDTRELTEGFQVTSILRESEIERAGLQIGDQIVEIDGHSVRGLSGEGLYLSLLKKGKPVALTVERSGKRIFVGVPAIGKSNGLSHWMWREGGRSVAIVRLETFFEGADKLIGSWLATEGREAEAVLVDFRGDPGGLLDEARAFLSRFIPRGPLFVKTGRSQVAETVLPLSGVKTFPGAVVVMVDANSASASETVASALQDWDRAIVVGQRTFGKGSGQVVEATEEGFLHKITSFVFHRPSGRSVQNDGVVPDITLGAPIQEPYGERAERNPLRLDAIDSAEGFRPLERADRARRLKFLRRRSGARLAASGNATSQLSQPGTSDDWALAEGLDIVADLLDFTEARRASSARP
jgi:carboxyl-terminal processing protease